MMLHITGYEVIFMIVTDIKPLRSQEDDLFRHYSPLL